MLPTVSALFGPRLEYAFAAAGTGSGDGAGGGFMDIKDRQGERCVKSQ